MKKFNYADEKISAREILVSVPTIIMGVGILFLPTELSKDTVASDGWIPMVSVGLLTIGIALCIAKTASHFPGRSFMEYTTNLATKPVAVCLTFLYAIAMFNGVSYTTGSLANVTEKYILTETPIEVTALTFLLVVIYAVSGSRTGILRLNMMFFPIIVFIAFVVVVFTLRDVETANYFPMFETGMKEYMHGMKSSVLSFTGISILWFYIPLMRKPQRAPKMAVIGLSMSITLYLLWFFTILGVFGNAVTGNLVYPAIELAKTTEIPGEFFERFESVFFVIWIMVLFNGAAMFMDILVHALKSVFTNVRKQTMLYIVSPAVYFVAMVPKDIIALSRYGSWGSYITFTYTLFVAVLLFLLTKVRGVR